MTFAKNLIRYTQGVLHQPTSELNRAQWYLRYAMDLARHCTRTLQHDRAAQMAAALTYRTIFSLVPMVVLAVLVLQLVYTQDRAIRFLNENVIKIFNVPTPELQETISDQVTIYAQKAYELSFRSIGAVGLIVLIWAAMAMAITVEQCCNRVYNSAAGRSWRYRITIYWAVFTLGPILIVASVCLGSQLVVTFQDIPIVGALLNWTMRFGALAASWLLLLLLYTWMPNAKVHLRPALIGSFVAAILWEMAKWSFQLYVTKAVTYSAVYGSLGLIPLFLIWLYLSWLIVLFGLEVAYTLQTLKYYQLSEERTHEEEQVMADPRWLIAVMARIGNAFTHGQVISNQQLSQELGLPIRAVVQMGGQLEKAGLLHQVPRGDDQILGYTLAKSPDRILIAGLLALGGGLPSASRGSSSEFEQVLLERLALAQREEAGDQTLATLIQEV